MIKIVGPAILTFVLLSLGFGLWVLFSFSGAFDGLNVKLAPERS